MATDPPGVRERILDAAVALLRDFGVKKLAQPQVARAAGVPQGHLTYYFPRKVDLVSAVAERFLELLSADLKDAADAIPWREIDDATRTRMLGMVVALIKNQQRTRMLLGLVVESETDPALRAALLRGAQTVRKVLARVLDREEDDADVNMALGLFWGLGVQHLVFASVRTDDEADAVLARIPVWMRGVGRSSGGGNKPTS